MLNIIGQQQHLEQSTDVDHFSLTPCQLTHIHITVLPTYQHVIFSLLPKSSRSMYFESNKAHAHIKNNWSPKTPTEHVFVFFNHKAEMD